MAFKEVDLKDLSINPFSKIGDEWALVTAGNSADGINTMTVSWGGLGIIWNENVATIYVRPQRYTKQFIDANDEFTLSFYAAEHKRALGVLGTKSGRDTDKIAEVGFTPVFLNESGDGVPAFEQADLVFVCRKLYADDIKPERFIDRTCDESCYPEHDYHTMYIAKIERALVRA